MAGTSKCICSPSRHTGSCLDHSVLAHTMADPPEDRRSAVQREGLELPSLWLAGWLAVTPPAAPMEPILCQTPGSLGLCLPAPSCSSCPQAVPAPSSGGSLILRGQGLGLVYKGNFISLVSFCHILGGSQK